MLLAIGRELELQQDYLRSQTVNTVYFGGGTPSLLTGGEIGSLLTTVDNLFCLEQDAEVTLEANPDDLTADKLTAFRKAGINRLSIGIQSFFDDELKLLNRAHSSAQAKACVEEAQAAGFENVSIDLIYAIPGQSINRWQENISQAVALNPQHISAYGLTIEEKTVFGRWKSRGTFIETPENEAALAFELLMNLAQQHNFEQYEISNFAKPGFQSRHNSSYWKGEHYLGVGPSAHSFNGVSRQHNKANNALYVKSIEGGKVPCDIEILSRENRINEYIFTSLRTQEGCSLQRLRDSWGFDLRTAAARPLRQLLNLQLVILDGDVLKLSLKGKLMADQIAVELFTATSD